MLNDQSLWPIAITNFQSSSVGLIKCSQTYSYWNAFDRNPRGHFPKSAIETSEQCAKVNGKDSRT